MCQIPGLSNGALLQEMILCPFSGRKVATQYTGVIWRGYWKTYLDTFSEIISHYISSGEIKSTMQLETAWAVCYDN